MHRLFIFVVMCLIAACSTPSDGPVPAISEPRVASISGKVVRMNPARGYVVLECTYLPFAGEEITLYRNNRAVGRVRAGVQASGNFIGADILEGTLMVGDWFMVETPRPFK